VLISGVFGCCLLPFCSDRRLISRDNHRIALGGNGFAGSIKRRLKLQLQLQDVCSLKLQDACSLKLQSVSLLKRRDGDLL
jgi:hypothetical protein